MTVDWSTVTAADNFVIQTPRLLIRPLLAADEPLYLSLYTSSAVMAFISSPLQLDQAKNSFQMALRLNVNVPFKRLFLAICFQDKPIGLCAVNQWNMQTKSAEVGLMLLPCWQRQGYATEALLALTQRVQQLFSAVQIWADMNPNNKAVVRLFIKAGFSADSTQPGRYWLRSI